MNLICTFLYERVVTSKYMLRLALLSSSKTSLTISFYHPVLIHFWRRGNVRVLGLFLAATLERLGECFG